MADLGAVGFISEIAVLGYDIEISHSGTAVTLTARVTVTKRGRLETWRVANCLDTRAFGHWDDIALT